ncbi:DUF4012 domain-containing protein [Candidatus Shapirobacteria bacterium]|nr:DUF4012 domain-containing protein [Candidatus Shapirobacteria bacterium]
MTETIINLTTNPSVDNPPITPPLKSNKKSKFLTFLINFLSIVVILGTITAVSGFFLVYLPAKNFSIQVLELKNSIDPIKTAINDKDLKALKVQLDNLRSKIKLVGNRYQYFAFAQTLPIARDYYQDGLTFQKMANDALDTGDILIKAIEPYQDFLGFKGSSTDSGKTTEDRITFLTQSIEGLLPHLDSIEKKIVDIDTALNTINIDRYPENYKDIAIRQEFNKAKETLAEVRKLVTDGKPILTKTSWLLGKDKPRNYLIVFQNDGELRPSGGFWTAYASIKMDKGKVIPGGASNIYDIDDKLASTIPAPRIIKSYHINVPYLNLRDSNLSPDFPTDAKIFLSKYYQAMGQKDKFDAVIAIDTQVLIDMVKTMGKLDTRVGTFTTEPDKRCDGCPKIIYDLEWISGRPRNYIEKNRKDFLAPLMHALLANAMGSDKTKLPILGEAFFSNLMEKHIMVFFPDTDMQTAAEKANIAGKIVAVDNSTDYFHLNDANFASAKSNIFIRQKIKHEINVKNTVVEHKVTVTYTNPSPGSNCNLEKGDLCLNAPTYRNLFRFYVPTGSKLIKMTGTEVDPVQYEELDKQVFEGFYGNKYPLYAKNSLKTSVQYTSSVPASKNYTLLLQKQPGTKPMDYEIWVNGKKDQSFAWSTDKTIKLSF